jgi:hypothetical protein
MSVRDNHIDSGKPQIERILVEKSSDEAADNGSVAEMVERRKKSGLVKSACLHCRRRKAKCSGERPACQFCRRRDLDCQWQTPEGLTRLEGLKRELRSVTSRTNDLRMLVGGMRTGSDQEATTLLARLRLGDSVEELAHAASTVLGQSETEQLSSGCDLRSVPDGDKHGDDPQQDVEEVQHMPLVK